MNNALSQFLAKDHADASTTIDASSPPLFIAFMLPSRSQAFSYSHLYSVVMEDSIELTFTSHSVRLAGRSLESLFWGIQRQLIARVDCIDELHAEARNVKAFVSSIDIRTRSEDTL